MHYVEPSPAIARHLQRAVQSTPTAIIWCSHCQANVVTYFVGASQHYLQYYHETVCINTSVEIRHRAMTRLANKWFASP